jgi:DNA-binding SARP family transcriptional activator
MLSIKLLGSPQILDNENPIRISRRKSRAFLYYLAASPAPLTREHLLAFFWPDHERSSGQQILRTTLHELRKVIGAVLLAEDETIAIAAGVDIDVRKFEALSLIPLSEPAQLSVVLDLYRGEFLENFELPDSSDFENWQTFQAQYYRRVCI